MRVSYTLAEINASNKFANVIMLECDAGIKVREKFSSLKEAVECISANNDSDHVKVQYDENYVILTIDENATVDLLAILGKHAPAVVGFITAVKGLLKVYRSALLFVKQDFDDFGKKYGKEKLPSIKDLVDDIKKSVKN